MADLKDLAVRYLAACSSLGIPGWKPGMLTANRYRVVRVTDGLPMAVSEDDQTDSELWALAWDWIPDLSDPPTLGAVLATARTAWNDQDLCLMPRWKALVGHRLGSATELCSGETEAEVLVKVLEIAVFPWSESSPSSLHEVMPAS